MSDTGTWTHDGFEMVVGLEVHVELATNTKLFSGAPNRFGDDPNTNIDPVSLGLPGALPVLNRQAVELAMRIGLALICTVQSCTFARKNYFYPDMPKAYQISQYDRPLNIDGHLEIADGVVIGVERAHLEEDTGKSTHIGGSGRIHGSEGSLIDFNRAGVPLVEIVSRPDIRSPEQARQYVNELRAILVEIGASDARMEEGSMRVDANVSVRRPDEEFGTRCEIKNVNSVRSLGRAIDYEARRQVAMISDGETIRQETRHWDEGDGRTHTLRTKEDADDYRYFPDPDLMPVKIDQAWIDRVRKELPEKPFDKQRRYQQEMNLPYSITSALCGDHLLCAYFEEAAGLAKSAGKVANWVVNDLLRELSQANKVDEFAEEETEKITPQSCAVSPQMLAELVNLIEDGKLTNNVAKEIFPEMFASGKSAADLIKEKGLEQKSDDGEIEGICAEAIANDPDAAEKFRGGKEGAINALKGAVMKATRGQANPKVVDETLRRLLS